MAHAKTIIDAQRKLGWVTIGEAAETLQLAKSTIYGWTHNDKVKSKKVGYHRFVKLSEIKSIAKDYGLAS